MIVSGAALQQWGRLFHYVSRRRQENVSDCAASCSKHLLEDSSSFLSQEAIKCLFGQTFLNCMLKSANQELKLNQIEETLGLSGTTRALRSNSQPGQHRGDRGRASRGPGSKRRESAGSRYVNFSTHWTSTLC